MALGKNEPVPLRPPRVLGIEAQHPAEVEGDGYLHPRKRAGGMT